MFSMFSSTKPSKPTVATKPIKSLSTPLPTSESKTPECETVAESAQKQQIKQSSPPKQSSPARSTSIATSSESSAQLSSRAAMIKQSLKQNIEVDAVVISVDGKYDQIKYSASSKQTNKILGGRPTIIGELEGIQAVIVRSLNQSNCGPLNKSILPAPFCNKQYNGNYLVYGVDEEGNPINLSVKQYEQYVADKKDSTEKARKNYNPMENQEIKASSSFNSTSSLTLVYLKSEVDKKVRSDFEQKNGKKPTDSEIEDEVNAAVQKLVDDIVSQSTPMNDPDYKPEDDDETYDPSNSSDERLAKRDAMETRIFDQETRLKTIYEDEKAVIIEENQDIDDRSWRAQLNDALDYVREKGKLDGQDLAEKISETYYELNGAEPTLDQLSDIFSRIKNELAMEAEEDIADQGRGAADDGSAFYLAKKLGDEIGSADPSDLVDYAFRIVREDLVSRAKSSFNISKGRDPSKYELQETVNKLALKIAEEAMSQSGSKGSKLIIDDEDEDDSYDPNNVDDKKLAKQDAMETKHFDQDFFNLKMLTTAGTKSKGGRSTTYDVYFCKFSDKRQARNLEQAIASFEMRNKRQPNSIEIAHIKQFISCQDTTKLVQFKLSAVDSEDEEKYGTADKQETDSLETKVLVSPIKEKKTAARYSVYFEDTDNSDKNEKIAVQWFERFNHRSPTDPELAGIKQFIKTDKSDLTECQYKVPKSLIKGDDDCKDTEEDDKIFRKMRTKDYILKKGNNATGYTLNFGGDTEERELGDEKQALKWFKRFNNRDPTDDEVEKMKCFVRTDQQDTIDID